MSRGKFVWTFTISRLLRHVVAVWLGLRYGKHVLDFWNKFSARWGTPILIVLWTGILISVSYAFWQIWKTRNSLGSSRKPIADAAAT